MKKEKYVKWETFCKMRQERDKYKLLYEDIQGAVEAALSSLEPWSDSTNEVVGFGLR